MRRKAESRERWFWALRRQLKWADSQVRPRCLVPAEPFLAFGGQGTAADKEGIFQLALLFHIKSRKLKTHILHSNKGRRFPTLWALLLSPPKTTSCSYQRGKPAWDLRKESGLIFRWQLPAISPHFGSVIVIKHIVYFIKSKHQQLQIRHLPKKKIWWLSALSFMLLVPMKIYLWVKWLRFRFLKFRTVLDLNPSSATYWQHDLGQVTSSLWVLIYL